MDRRSFLKTGTLIAASLSLPGCGYLRVDPDSVFIRSDIIDSPAKEQEILNKAKLTWTADKRIPVLILSGTPYERGYQHGALLRSQVRDNLTTLYENAKSSFHIEELFDESFERLRPFIPQDYIEEMHGLAHGSRLPLRMIHAIHALPEMTEWGGKKKIKKIVKQMMDGELLGTSCSNFCVDGSATKDGHMYTVRILDWGLHRLSKLHQYPLIMVNRPEEGIPSAVIGWIGFIGAVSGMNAEGITLGEMGYGDNESETLRGEPMPFVLRDILTKCRTLKETKKLIADYPGTNSFVYMMSDGKTGQSEMYIKDHKRFLAFSPEQEIKDDKEYIAPIKDTLYAGHYNDVMQKLLTEKHGEIDAQMIMKELIPAMAMPSNFQNVVYDPSALRFWVSNAAGPGERAAEQSYTFFDLGAVLNAAPE